MALINCSECNKEISDKAALCPGCGAPINIMQDMKEKDDPKPIHDNSQVKKYKGVLVKDGQQEFKTTKIKTVFAKSEDEAKAMFSKTEGFSLDNSKLRVLPGEGKFNCPNCKGIFTLHSKNIGCAVMIIIFISLGLGLIMIPFLPHQCECELCGFKWKA